MCYFHDVKSAPQLKEAWAAPGSVHNCIIITQTVTLKVLCPMFIIVWVSLTAHFTTVTM